MQKLSPSAICPMTGESANSQKMERINGRANLARKVVQVYDGTFALGGVRTSRLVKRRPRVSPDPARSPCSTIPPIH